MSTTIGRGIIIVDQKQGIFGSVAEALQAISGGNKTGGDVTTCKVSPKVLHPQDGIIRLETPRRAKNPTDKVRGMLRKKGAQRRKIRRTKNRTHATTRGERPQVETGLQHGTHAGGIP